MASLVEQTLREAPEPERRRRERRRSLVEQVIPEAPAGVSVPRGPDEATRRESAGGLGLRERAQGALESAFGTPPEPPPESSAGRKARLFLREVPEGAARTVDFFGRAAREGAERGLFGLGGLAIAGRQGGPRDSSFTEDPVIPPSVIEGAERLGERISGLPQEDPTRTFGEDVARFAGEEAGATLATGPFFAARAARRARLGRDLTLEGGSIAGAATGRAIVGEDAGEVSQILAGVAGGVTGAGAASAGRRVAQIPLNMVDRRLPPGVTFGGRRVPGRRSERIAAETVQDIVADRERALRTLDEIEQMRAQGVEVPQIPLGAMVNDPGLRSFERRAAVDPAQSLALEEARRQGSERVRRAVIALGPPRNARPEAASAAARLHVEGRIAQAEEAVQAAQRRVENQLAAQDVGLHQRREAISQVAREELERVEREVFEPFDEMYRNVEKLAEESGAVFSTRNVKAAAKRISQEAGEFGENTLPREILDRILNLPDAVGFRVLRSLQRRLNDMADPSNLPPEARPQRRNVAILADAVWDDIDAADTLGTAPEVAEQLRSVNAMFRRAASEFRDRRTAPASSRIFSASGRGPAAPSETLGLYFKPGAVERAREFNRIARRSPTLTAEMRRYIVQDAFESSADTSGKINPDRLARWRRKHSSVLDEFPEASALVGSVEDAQRAVSVMGFRLDRLQQNVNRSALGLLVDNPERAVKKAMKDPREAARLVNLVKDDPEALAGLRKEVWDNVVLGRFRRRHLTAGESGIRNQSVAEIRKGDIETALQKNGESLRMLFGDKHIENLRTYLDIQDAVDRIPRAGVDVSPARPNTLATLAGMLLNSGVIRSQILSPSRRALRGGQVTSQFLREITNEQAQALFQKAIWDPALMRTLLTKPVPQNIGALEGALRSNLISLGYRVQDEVRGRGEE